MPLPIGYEKFDRRLAREEVYQALREWIIVGEMAPGEQLRDVELAKSLGLSRTPVREALRRLEDEGLVQTQLNRWTRVAPVDIADAHTRFPIIWTLERLAIELTRIPFDAAELDAMDEANARIKAALDQGAGVAASRADEHFHQLLISHCDNDELERIMRDQRSRLRRFAHRYFEGNFVADRSVTEHASIISALREEDLTRAASAVEAHWRASYQRQIAQLESTAEFDAESADVHLRGGVTTGS